MADIDIVPKERSYTWLWVLLALAIIGVLWYALAGGRNDEPVGAPGGHLVPQHEVTPAASSSLRTADRRPGAGGGREVEEPPSSRLFSDLW